MTVAELLSRISSVELTEWMEVYRREPFGEDWKQTAYICSLISNGLLKRKTGGSWEPKEFYPVRIIEPVQVQSDNEIEVMLMKAATLVTVDKKPKKKK